MPNILYKNKTFHVPEGSSVLDVLELGGVDIQSSCRNGVCQTCKKKVIQGNVPSSSQARLKPTEQAAGFFLPCVCYPTEDITITDIDQAPQHEVTILSVALLNQEIAEIKFLPPLNFSYKAGQYIQILKDSKHVRTYSLASIPEKNEPLTIQVRRIPGGIISAWLHSQQAGEKINIKGPFGECFYTSDRAEQPIVLIGTGSGLSPLYGILHDALLQGHKGEIYLFHGVARQENIYKETELRKLSSDYPQFRYFPCLSEEKHPSYEQGMVLDVAFKQALNMKSSRVFLCGHPEMVKTGRKKIFMAGVPMKDIYVDPFG